MQRHDDEYFSFTVRYAIIRRSLQMICDDLHPNVQTITVVGWRPTLHFHQSKMDSSSVLRLVARSHGVGRGLQEQPSY